MARPLLSAGKAGRGGGPSKGPGTNSKPLTSTLDAPVLTGVCVSQLAAAVSEASTRLSVSAAEKDASAAALATRLRMSEERLAEAVSKEVRLSLSSQWQQRRG